MVKTTLGIALVLCLLGAAAGAQVPPGIGSAAFARLGVDARCIAMGGAHAATTGASPIAFYNAASLAGAVELDMAALYAQPFGSELGISYQHVSACVPLRIQTGSERGLGVALSWMGMQIADIMIWDEEDPSSGTTFTATSSILLASIGYEVIEGLSVGGSAKVYKERILEGRGNGLGLDVGALYSGAIEGVDLVIGLNSTDIGRTKVKWSGTTGNPDNFVAWVNRLSLAAGVPDWNLWGVAGFDWAIGRPPAEQVVRTGIEWSVAGLFSLRAGWRTNLAGSRALSGGVGVRLFDTIQFDYAYVMGVNAAHYASLHLTF